MTQTQYKRHQIYADGDFKIWTQCSPEKFIFPFEGITDSYLMEQDWMGYADYYFQNMPVMGSVHKVYAGMYFISDSQPTDMGAGVFKVTRTYGLLPGFNNKNQRIEAESYVWTKPGINHTNAGAYPEIKIWYVDRSATSYPNNTDVILYTNINPSTGQRWVHDLNTNYNIATILYNINDPALSDSSAMVNNEYQATIITRGTTWIQVPKITYTTSPIEYIYFSQPQIQINPRQRVVQSFLYYTYYLPGVNCTSVQSISLEQPFRILDQNQNETDSVTETTTPPLFTNGTIIGYNNMVAAQTSILVEYPTIRRWKGNIYEKMSRYITII